ncbi:hypothetical protein AAA799P11_00751 [Marine Group I thaumarchaeote SCGC AAA799-P11]|uniref:Uncharacterized protein n=1 Tax=Marine Group I thaumarchaeote SCGC AAA799-P11 TaxID=1502295 RepID=A0A087S123_9ARCH|nr:hypothetical protein AAA799P11_00751 [Marine Group I thaumarchaeote SCGC AAA799-P11]
MIQLSKGLSSKYVNVNILIQLRLANVGITLDSRNNLIERKNEYQLTYSEFIERLCVLYDYCKENHKPTFELLFLDPKKEKEEITSSLPNGFVIPEDAGVITT